ncbi:hypothetical protein IEQ34_004651 [Dendrobium chrysotoxum]|uniref:Uncharacterized protein n=1 Tax=Dendrobium chrysotoxum TaxID=161865 RepID=A0AAV7HHA1_DENCH|nr:hypothetical protein IEQ34_004651 [Dendrobium chrysotoxum]
MNVYIFSRVEDNNKKQMTVSVQLNVIWKLLQTSQISHNKKERQIKANQTAFAWYLACLSIQLLLFKPGGKTFTTSDAIQQSTLSLV